MCTSYASPYRPDSLTGHAKRGNSLVSIMAMMSYVHDIQTVYNLVENPQMVLLSEMVSARCEKVYTLRNQGGFSSKYF